MNVWQWFCRLGRTASAKDFVFWQEHAPPKSTPSGAEICTRMCGHSGCRCGGTMRGLYCIWSYYRE
ncbi:MAG: hypothetical protein LLG02_16675 [Pelosinus sp.]|nr:hypothetical protein [Pelosinus sp.]